MQNSSPTPATLGNPSPSPAIVGDPSPSLHRRLSKLILKLVIIIVMIILCVFVIFVIFELFFPTMPHFEVESLSLTNFNSSESVTGTWQVGLLVKNYKRYFATLKSTLYYQNVLLSESLKASFKQGSMPKTSLNVTLSAADVKVKRFVLDDINRDREHGLVAFDVHVAGCIHFVPHMMNDFSLFKGWNLHVLCSSVVVGISSNTLSGNLVAGTMDCKVDYYRA